jgi:hypothetical protein
MNLNEIALSVSEDAKRNRKFDAAMLIATQEPELDRSKYEAAIAELKAKGTFAGCIENGPDGKFIGMVYEKDMSFALEAEQNHFAKSVEWWAE